MIRPQNEPNLAIRGAFSAPDGPLPFQEVTMSKKLAGLCLTLLALTTLPGCVAYPAYGPGYYAAPYPRAYYHRPHYRGGWGYYR